VEQFGDPNQLAHHQIELIWVQREKYGFIFQPNLNRIIDLAKTFKSDVLNTI
jgi:hypothetical protein